MTREDITRLIKDNGLFHGTVSIGVIMDMNHLERFVALVAAAEREACAKVCDDLDAMKWTDFGEYKCGYSDVIRARGQDPMPLFDDWGMK